MGVAARRAIREGRRRWAMPRIIRVMEVATFYTMFNLEPVGATSSRCAARRRACWPVPTASAACICEKRVGPQRQGDGRRPVLVDRGRVPRRLGCNEMAPMVQINDDYYEDLTCRPNFDRWTICRRPIAVADRFAGPAAPGRSAESGSTRADLAAGGIMPAAIRRREADELTMLADKDRIFRTSTASATPGLKAARARAPGTAPRA